MAATRLNGTTEAPAPRTVPIPTTGAGNVHKLCASLFNLTQQADVPRWVQAAAVELCRDHHVTMVAIG